MNTDRTTPLFSVIVPVFNGAGTLGLSLASLRASSLTDFELIVVDDGSTDESASIATEFGARLLRTGGRQGPGAARNLGVAEARGEFVVFLDADCSPAPDALQLAADLLHENAQIDALFGSYDDQPTARGLVSRYRNLQHHHVHQTGCREASTFWAGCGVMRRSTFQDLGGFDIYRYPRPSIEDIELGYRLRAKGGKIRLAPDIQVKHHKAWTLTSVLRTDLFDRGIPWTRLLMEKGGLPNDLNLNLRSRISVVMALAVLAGLALTPFWSVALWVALGSGSVLLWLNRDFYRLLARKGGLRLLVAGVALHWIYQLNCAVAYLVGRFSPWPTDRGLP